MRRELTAQPALLLVLALAGCGGGDAPAQSGRGGPGGERVVPVRTVTVERQAIARELELTGAVEPIRWVSVTSQLSATVLSVHVEEGSRVGAGAILARLDVRELVPQLASAQASYEVARAAFQRAEQLFARQVITVPEYERDRAALAAAQAQVRQLQTRIGYGTLRSPLSGVVVEKNVEAGDVVPPQQTLFRVADVSTLVVRVGVSELDVASLAPGDTVGITLDAEPLRPLRGTIRRIFPAAEPDTRLVPVEVALEPGSPARPGYLARVTLVLEERRDVAVVPAGAILPDGDGSAAFVVVDGRAVRREVQTGLVSKGRIEVVSGLAAGEIVVVEGNQALRDGAAVRPAGTETPPTPAGAGS